MSTPFDIARQVGEGFAPLIERERDRGHIDEILESVSSKNGNIDNAMEMILQRVSPNNREAALRILQSKKERLSGQQRAQTYEQLGLPPGAASLSEGERRELLKERGVESKRKQELQPVREGLRTLKSQRELLKTGHLGPKFGITETGRKAGSTFSKEGSRVRAQYEQQGKSLISLASKVPIKNKEQFNTLAAKLFDTSLGQETIEGTLDAMEAILKNQLGEEEIDVSENIKTPQGQERVSLKEIFG